MNAIKNFLCASLVTCLFCVFSSVWADTVYESSNVKDPHIFHLYEDMDLIATLKERTTHHPKMYVKWVYPQLESGNGSTTVNDFNQLVQNLLQEETDKFQNKVTQNVKGKNKTTANFYIDYDASYVKSGENNIISVRFTLQAFMPNMAHPYHYHRILNYDLETGETIQLADLFRENANYLAAFADYTSQYLLRHLSSKEMVMEGTAPKAENFVNWNIKPNGILMTFDEATVAPYAYGPQNVLVPFSVLKRILSPDSALGRCAKAKHCVSDRLLTGGFIDEAINTQHRRFNPILS